FFSSRRRHTRWPRDWSSDVCSSDLMVAIIAMAALSIDIITLYLAREEAQRSADQAALAAARVISISGLTGDPTDSSSLRQLICRSEERRVGKEWCLRWVRGLVK